MRSILITGCSSGIGLDAALGLRDAGWRVFASCKQEMDCARLREMGFKAPRIDYTDTDSIETGLAEVLEATGGTLDALFNNGAHGLPGAVEDVPTDGLRAIFEANVFGLHHLTRAVLPVMRAQGHGRIINNSSVLGFVAIRWRGAYVATKYALEGLTDALRLELADTGIHVILLQPGPIRTDIRQKSVPHFERWIDWEASALAPLYRATLVKRLYADAPTEPPKGFEKPPSAVTEALLKALNAPRPRARYRITTPTRIAAGLTRLLSTSARDRILKRF